MNNIPEIIDAINKGEYKLTFEGPNNVEICTKYDGSEFYRLIDDSVKFGVCGGFSIVSILDSVFYCDLGTGDWLEGDGYNGEYITDKLLIKALENIPGILKGVMMTPDEQMEVYFKANPNAKDFPYFWCEDEDCPADIDNLGFNDVEITINYTLGESNIYNSLIIMITDENLYNLYRLISKREASSGQISENEEYKISSLEIEEYDNDLYSDILDSILSKIDDSEDDKIRFIITVNHDLFESNL